MMNRRTKRSVLEHESDYGFRVKVRAWTDFRLDCLNLFPESIPASALKLMVEMTHARVDAHFIQCLRPFLERSFIFSSSGNVVFGLNLVSPISTLHTTTEISPSAWREALWCNEGSSS